jgi:WD40 repeat protein
VSNDGDIILSRLPNGDLLKNITGKISIVNSVAFSADSTILASGGEDGVIRLWKIPSGELSKALADINCGTVEIDYDPIGYIGTGCTCNTVCTCDKVCTCDTVGGSSCGGTYWYPN